MNFIWKNKLVLFLVLILGLGIMPLTFTPAQVEEDDSITLNIKDQDIKDVIMLIAATKNFNYEIAKEVTGTISVKLDHVPLEEALKKVIVDNGYEYERIGSLLKVGSSVSGEKELKRLQTDQDQTIPENISEDRSSESLNNSISLEYVDGNIQDVIAMIATAKNLNYVIGKDVTGTVTLKLENVSFDTALEAVVISRGYQYRIKENLLKVDTREQFAKEDEMKKSTLELEQLLTKIFELKYLNGKDIIDLLKSQNTERGKIIPLQPTLQGGYTPTSVTGSSANISQGIRQTSKPQETVDRLMVIDTPSAISAIKRLIDELDVMPLQILIESKMIESQAEEQLDLGIRWDFLGAGATGTGGFYLGLAGATQGGEANLNGRITRTFVDIGNHVKTDDTTHGRPAADNYTTNSNLDTVLNTMTSSTDPSGVTTTTSQFLDTGEITNDTSVKNTLDQSLNSLDTNTINRITTATLSASQFDLILNSLKTRGDVEIISNPSIMTLNNNEASILVGERYPILRSSTSDQGTTVQTFDHYEPIGIQLQVLPRVLHNDYVSMIIRPSVTSIGSSVGSSQLQINRINTREANTQLVVKGGDTVVIGGLLSDKNEKGGSSVPFLSRIPILGKLFSYKHTTNNKINLTVFVTPSIVRNNE
ncbi:MAG: hypothetical protein JW774_03605 [Candidatus Aureabacteria bacterium]|nr:hypothetical protein [Candidatus Auribacterota bacterium]